RASRGRSHAPRKSRERRCAELIAGASHHRFRILQRRKTMTDSAQPFADIADDARVSETPLVDKGFASVRKIGNGLYATISDLSTADTTVCNGGLLGGRELWLPCARLTR